MISRLYIEKEIAQHPRCLAIKTRLPNVMHIECAHYSEVFNPKSQNFRVQKNNPALIIAHKQNNLVLPVPAGYELNGQRGFYFSHMLNCIYDCRYCFLQGMYQSANYVLFINYEDTQQAIDQTLEQFPDETLWFFSGYDCDSLAFEPTTHFAAEFLPFFATRPRAMLELRTKSTQIRSLLKITAIPNCIIAFSFTPQNISSTLEDKVPSVAKRINAMLRLQQAGWNIALRFDPLIYKQGIQQHYTALFTEIFSTLDIKQIHSISFGNFRLPKKFYRKISTLYPDNTFLAGPFVESNGIISYGEDMEHELLHFCHRELGRLLPASFDFPQDISAHMQPPITEGQPSNNSGLIQVVNKLFRPDISS